MALFETKTKKRKSKEVTNEKAVIVSSADKTVRTMSGTTILRPRITEKASYATGNHAYVFDVDTRSTKKEIAQAFKEIYGFIPQKVRTTTIKTKMVTRRGMPGTKGGGKKATIVLKKGEKIEII